MAILICADSVPMIETLMLRRLFEILQPEAENPLLVRKWAKTSLTFDRPNLGRTLAGTLCLLLLIDSELLSHNRIPTAPVQFVNVLLIEPLTILRVKRPGCAALAHTLG